MTHCYTLALQARQLCTAQRSEQGRTLISCLLGGLFLRPNSSATVLGTANALCSAATSASRDGSSPTATGCTRDATSACGAHPRPDREPVGRAKYRVQAGNTSSEAVWMFGIPMAAAWAVRRQACDGMHRDLHTSSGKPSLCRA